ncbi:DnaJ domain-containing protein [Arcobacteraceae bacterium]|nr:DnaJ domain-containing protein [Arcobacteraceae bacterium]
MIKKTLTIFLALIFLILKKIFIRENRTPNKFMDGLANKLHSLFIYTSFPILYLLWFNLYEYNVDINSILYIILFLEIIVIIRYFNPQMLVTKVAQVKLLKTINKVSLLVFISNWVLLSFGFALSFLLILLLNNIFYTFIINQIKKQKEQAEFKKQFGEEGRYSKEDIVKKHILNLFEASKEVSSITKSDVKKQYRNMAKKYHPDVYKGSEKDKFTSINQSYNFLLDFVK